jgi:hypothetical protein
MAEEKKVNSQDKVIVIGTEASKFLKTGKEYEVTIIHAKTLVKNGQASYPKKSKE